MEQRKTKIGARILSDSEIKLILPTAESVYEHIEVFRRNISVEEEYGKQEQKTNNIGIMGRRGAGKTSILKTFYQKLVDGNKDREEKDVILPIIVPENMSSGVTLMDVVLGMLKPVAEERDGKSKEWKSEDCIYRGRSALEKTYNELVKKYCYIKKDYRDILIQEFTTEQVYVDKTKEVFNSDTEFLKQLHLFINELFRKEKGTATDAMIFLFIDDIDLSTTRCIDVAKTLLSYLSHPRIVTFISGDMETFEESLTLDFLRQEQALDAEVFGKTFYRTMENHAKSSLLERKKLLAYEYLKKIIPPAYRKMIKYWPLEERGTYAVEEQGHPRETLAQLLVKSLDEKLEKAYFVYGEEDLGYLNVTYHLFDDTSRGLNNVYNALQELSTELEGNKKAEEGKKDEESRQRLVLWRLVETIIDSKPFYAKHQEQLKTQVLIFTQAQAKVNFESAYNWLFGEKEAAKKGKSIFGAGQEFTSEERFAMFTLFDFVCRLFHQEQMDDGKYIKLKNRIMQEYISDETIEGKIVEKRGELDFQKLERVNQNGNRAILVNFIQQGSYLFNLYLVKYLGRETIYQIFEKEKWGTEKQENLYKIAYSLVQTAKAIGGKSGGKEYLALQYKYIQKGMEQLLDGLPLSSKVIYGEQLLGHRKITGLGYDILNKNEENSNISEWWFYSIENELSNSKTDNIAMKRYRLVRAEHMNDMYLYWLYYEKCWKEQKKRYHDIIEMQEKLCARGVIKTILNQMEPVLDKYRIKKIEEGDYSFQEESDHEQAVIQLLDKHGLWEKEYVKGTVYQYLEKKIKNVILQMAEGRLVFDARLLKKSVYEDLMECEEGSSGKALICGFKRELRKIMDLSYGHEFSDGGYYMRLEHVLVIQCMLEDFFESHPKVQFGKKEVWQLLLAMRELPLVCRSSGWGKIQQELKGREEEFFKKLENQLEDKVMEGLEKSGQLSAVKEYIQNRYYGENPSPTVSSLLAELQTKTDYKEGCSYLIYSVQRDEIKGRQKKLELSEKDRNQVWQQMEEESFNREDQFYIHSYLRFLQETNSDVAKAGARADDIAELVKDLIDSEIIADKHTQNEIYNLLSEEMGLTEEEFEGLFS